jgi:hypothetical protein
MPLWHNRQPDPEKTPETPKTARADRKTTRDTRRETRTQDAQRHMERKRLENGD